MKKITILCLAILTLSMLVAGCSNIGGNDRDVSENDWSIIFNEIESVMQGAPAYNSDAFSKEIPLSDINNTLGVDFQKNIPDSLSDFNIHAVAGYLYPEELYQLNIWIHDAEHEAGFGPGFGKTIYLSIASESWSERSVWSVDYVYDGTSNDISLIHGAEVDFQVWRCWESDVYIAEFSVDGLDYHIESGEGVTEKEFTEFVVNTIESHTIDAACLL